METAEAAVVLDGHSLLRQMLFLWHNTYTIEKLGLCCQLALFVVVYPHGVGICVGLSCWSDCKRMVRKYSFWEETTQIAAQSVVPKQHRYFALIITLYVRFHQ